MFVIKCKPFLLSILVPVIIGFLSGMLILPDVVIYSIFQLPPGVPPAFVFSNGFNTICVNGHLFIRYFFIQIRLHRRILLGLCSTVGVKFLFGLLSFLNLRYIHSHLSGYFIDLWVR